MENLNEWIRGMEIRIRKFNKIGIREMGVG